jgi:CRP-like cAMP-binding protein
MNLSADFILSDFLDRQLAKDDVHPVREISVKKGAFIYSPPQLRTNMYEIVEGAVKLGYYDDEAQEKVYEILEPGQFFGNLQFLDGSFSEFSKALVPTTLRCYRIELFKQAITQYSEVAEWFYKKIVHRWCRSERRLVFISRYEAQERILKTHASFMHPVHGADGKNYLLSEIITCKDLASLTGTTRQLVSKVLGNAKQRA